MENKNMIREEDLKQLNGGLDGIIGGPDGPTGTFSVCAGDGTRNTKEIDEQKING